jgi:hypothetical protein
MSCEETRLFKVRARSTAPHAQGHVHLIAEVSFEAACVAWLEGWPGEIGAQPALSVIVQDVATGHEHCFGIDLETGAAAPCG